MHAQIPSAPEIISSSETSIVAPGTDVTLTVSVSTSALSYQWFRNYVPLPGATAATLSLPKIQVEQAGLYTVQVAVDPHTVVTSMPAKVAVIGPEPAPGDRAWVLRGHSELESGTDWGLYVEILPAAILYIGDPPVQWYKDDVALPGQTDRNLRLSNVSKADAGRYHAVVAGYASSPGIITVDTILPAFEYQPQSNWAPLGASASFRVSLAAGSSVEFQWFRDGQPIPGATARHLDIFPVTAADYGVYYVRATNKAGTVDSDSARLDPPLLPTITEQPVQRTVAVGETLSLSVAATGDAAILPLSYQWSRDGLPIAGATEPSYTVPRATEADKGYYRVRVSGSRGGVYSDQVPVTVGFALPVEGVPVFHVEPKDIEAAVGSLVVFESSAGGRPPYAYQWMKNGEPLLGETTSSLVFSVVALEDAGDYAVTVTNPVGSLTSRTATLVVKPGDPGHPNAPKITRQPISVLAPPGGTAEFSFEVAATPPVSITWLHNGRPITGMTAPSTLVIENVQSVHAGTYQAHVSTSLGSVFTRTVQLTLEGAPMITHQPVGTELVEGANLVLQVGATGAPAPTYQWYQDGQPIPGAVDATYVLSEAPLSAAGAYSVRVSNSQGSVDSATVTVSVRRAAKYVGVYFGQFGADGAGGEFAVVVRPDGPCILIGYLSASSLGFTANFPISSDGAFDISENLIRMFGRLSGPAEVTRRASSGITGQIVGQSISGSWPAMKQTLSGQRNSDSGPTSAVAGYYAAGLVNSADVAYSIVGADGRLLVLRTSATGAVGSSGAISAEGEFVVDQNDGTKLMGRVDATTRTLTGTAVTASGDTSDFAGGEMSEINYDRLINISTRGWVGTDADQLIAGFVIRGSARRTVLIRAVGPTLEQFGVRGTLPKPALALVRDGATLATAGAWSGSIASETANRVGAFPLPAGSTDAVMVQTLEPGVYSVLVSPSNSTRGVALVEVYDASDTGDASAPARLINISTRGFVGTGDQLLIAGFAIRGANPKTVLIRGVGPSLSQFLSGVLADPVITVQSGDTEIARNDGWRGDQRLVDASRDVGAFALEPTSNDAVLLLTLKPGNYTALLRSKSGGTGRALIEVYEVNP